MERDTEKKERRTTKQPEEAFNVLPPVRRPLSSAIKV